MQAFEANFAAVVTRFYLMMAIVIAAGFTGYWLLGLFALPVFLTGILGFGNKKQIAKTAKLATLPQKVDRKAA